MAKEKQKFDDVPFQAAIEAAAASADGEGGGYLGDPNVLDALIRQLMADALEVITGNDSVEELEKGLDELAAILLGKRSKYAAVSGWNQPGGVDEFLVSHGLASIKDTPEGRIKTYLAALVATVRDVVLQASTEGIENEQWQWQIDAEAESYINVLRGIWIDPDQEVQGGGDGGATGDTGGPADGSGGAGDGTAGGETSKPAGKRRKLSRTQEAILRSWENYP